MKKYLTIGILTASLAASLAGFALAGDRPLEIDYPTIPGILAPPQTTKVLLPDYIMYWINLALVGSGFVVFGSMLWAGMQYLTSAGNPSKLSDSKDQIVSAFLGAGLLFGSYILLQSINPKITILRIGEISVGEGIRVKDASGNYLNGTAYIKTSLDCVGDVEKDPAKFGRLTCKNNFDANAIEFANSPNTRDYLDVYIYSDVNYDGTPTKITSANASPLPFAPRSIKLVWKTPGVYLYPEADYGGQPQIFTTTAADLGDFINQAKSIKIVDYLGSNFGVILHEKKNFEGKCWPATNDVNNLASAAGVLGSPTQTGSVTIFNKVGTATSGGVTLYSNPDFVSEIANYDAATISAASPYYQVALLLNNDETSSIKIEGSYLVALFEHQNYDGQCELFSKNDSNIFNNRMGKCLGFAVGSCPASCPKIPILNWCPPEFCLQPCASSMLIIPTR